MKYEDKSTKKMVDICGYEFLTNLQNFMQKDLTKAKIFPKVLGGGTFLKHPVVTCKSVQF